MTEHDDRTADERKRYTSRLQRRAQAHVTAELGREAFEDDIDRQIAMLIQHALATTGARRVTLFRPVPRGQRWHTVTVLDDGGFYHGLIAPDTLILPMVAYAQKRPVMLGPERPHLIPAPRPAQLGFRSYLGLPLIAGEQVVAVLEAVDVAQSELLEKYAESLGQAMEALTAAIKADATREPESYAPMPARDGGLGPNTVLDLVLRPPIDADDPIAIAAAEWAILAAIDGERRLTEVALRAQTDAEAATGVCAALLERGLIRVGRESRRRA